MLAISALPTKNWHVPSAPTRSKSQAAKTANLQHSLKGVQGENRNKALCALKKTDTTGKVFYEPEFLHLLIPRKTLKSLTVMSSLATKENTIKNGVPGVPVVAQQK